MCRGITEPIGFQTLSDINSIQHIILKLLNFFNMLLYCTPNDVRFI